MKKKRIEQFEGQKILNQIDWEVNNFQLENRRKGFTLWGMIGALGSIIILLINEVETSILNLDRALTLFLVVHLLGFSLQVLYKVFLNLKKNHDSDEYTFNPLNKFVESNFLTVDLMFKLISMNFVVYYVSKIVSFSYQPIMIFYIALFILYITFLLIYIFQDKLDPVFKQLPMVDVENSPSHGVLPGLVLLSLFAFSSYDLYTSAIQKMTFTIADFKFSGYSYLIYILVGLIAKNFRKPNQLQSLMDLRRDISLEKVPIDLAKYKLETILSGMNFNAAFQPIVSSFMNTSSEISEIQSELFEKCEIISEILEKDELSPADKHIVASLRDNIDEQYDVLASHVGKLEITHGFIEGQAKFALAFKVINHDDSQQLLQKLSKVILEYSNALDQLKDEMHSINENLESIN